MVINGHCAGLEARRVRAPAALGSTADHVILTFIIASPGAIGI